MSADPFELLAQSNPFPLDPADAWTPTADRILATVTAEEPRDTASDPRANGTPSSGQWWSGWIRPLGVAAVLAFAIAMAVGIRPTGQPVAEALRDLVYVVEVLPPEDWEGAAITRHFEESGVIESEAPSTETSGAFIPVWYERSHTLEYATDGSIRSTESITAASPLIPVSDEDAAFLESVFEVGEVHSVAMPADGSARDPFDMDGDVDAVRDRIDTIVSNYGNSEQTYGEQLFGFVKSLSIRQFLDPSERAKILEIISTTPGVEATRDGQNTNASLRYPLSYLPSESNEVEETLTFDSEGWLIRHTIVTLTGIPRYNLEPGDLLWATDQTPPIPVENS